MTPSSVFLLLRAPVAVGIAAMSTAEMLTSGLKGRGFSMLHTYQDHLWWVLHFFSFTGSWVGGEGVGLDSQVRAWAPASSLGKLLLPDMNFFA